MRYFGFTAIAASALMLAACGGGEKAADTTAAAATPAADTTTPATAATATPAAGAVAAAPVTGTIHEVKMIFPGGIEGFEHHGSFGMMDLVTILSLKVVSNTNILLLIIIPLSILISILTICFSNFVIQKNLDSI